MYDPDDALSTATLTQPVVVHNPYFATQLCRMCEELRIDTPATHEASAYVSWIDPKTLAVYLCCTHFGAVFGPEARSVCASDEMTA
jgi:hypothetical protein